MKYIDEINGRGLASGWHAQELQRDAERTGGTMADLFAERVKNSSAFSVPARAVRVTSAWVYYTFLDGSEARYPNQRGST